MGSFLAPVRRAQDAPQDHQSREILGRSSCDREYSSNHVLQLQDQTFGRTQGISLNKPSDTFCCTCKNASFADVYTFRRDGIGVIIGASVSSVGVASHVVATHVGIVVDDRDFVIAKTLARSIRCELAQVAFMVATQLQESASGTFRFRWSAASTRFSLARCLTAPECVFPSRRGAQEVWGNPPARLRGTMENASTGQMRSSNPPPGCGVGCARVRRSRLGVWSHGKVHSAQPVGSRMRFSVRGHTQNVLFRDPDLPECAFP